MFGKQLFYIDDDGRFVSATFNPPREFFQLHCTALQIYIKCTSSGNASVVSKNHMTIPVELKHKKNLVNI